MQEFAQTGNGQKFLANVNRIAVALERLADHTQKLAAANERLAAAEEQRNKRLDLMNVLTETIVNNPTEEN